MPSIWMFLSACTARSLVSYGAGFFVGLIWSVIAVYEVVPT